MTTIELKTIPLTQADIDLITFALRKLAEETGFINIKDDSENLREYIIRESKRENE